jgi:hypothetical protein
LLSFAQHFSLKELPHLTVRGMYVFSILFLIFISGLFAVTSLSYVLLDSTTL